MLDHTIERLEALSNYPISAGTVLGFVACVVCVNLYLVWRDYRHKETMRRGMSPTNTVKYKIQEKFHDVLFDMWCEDEIQEKDYDYYCRRLRDDFGFEGLRRRMLIQIHPLRLRHQLTVLKAKLKIKWRLTPRAITVDQATTTSEVEKLKMFVKSL